MFHCCCCCCESQAIFDIPCVFVCVFLFITSFIRFAHSIVMRDAIDHTVVVFYALSCSFIEFNAFDFRIDSQKGVFNIFLALTLALSSISLIAFQHKRKKNSTIENELIERERGNPISLKTVVQQRKNCCVCFLLFGFCFVHNHLGEVGRALCRPKTILYIEFSVCALIFINFSRSQKRFFTFIINKIM